MTTTAALVPSEDLTVSKSNCGWICPPMRVLSDDITSSSDDFHTKMRKPYTITKQREKWTEFEHEKFVEALKLYGRSWHHIKEHIGTKTAVQIRSHAQKFFSKVEREASDVSFKGRLQVIEIPPPRPKRKPNHPYPRKSGISSLSLEDGMEVTIANPYTAVNVDLKVEDTKSNLEIQGIKVPYTFDKGTLKPKPIAFPSLVSIKGLGSSEVDYPEKGKPTAAAIGEKFLKQPAEKYPAADGHGGVPCTDKNTLAHTINIQMHMHAESEESPTEAPTSAAIINTRQHAPSYSEASKCESEQHEETQGGYLCWNKEDSCILPSASQINAENETRTCRLSACHERAQSSPMSMWMDSCVNYHGNSKTVQAPPYGLAHKPLAYPTLPWQFMQASLMNLPAAFAATASAAAWAMGVTSPDCEGQPSTEDLSVAAYAAASASWWAFSGFLPPFCSHPGQHPTTAAKFKTPTIKKKVPEQVHFANATSTQTEGAVSSTAFIQGSQILKRKAMPSNDLPSDICNGNLNAYPDNQNQAQKNSSTSADELDGFEQKMQEGSSSGSNTPALLSSSRSPSENENEDFILGIEDNVSLYTTVDDTNESDFGRSLDKCVEMKHKSIDREKHFQKDSRHEENENGKRFKSGTHDADFRKEVSSQGRKAFEALFTCSKLPQTFSRGGMEENAVICKDKTKRQIVSGPLTYLDSIQAEGLARSEIESSAEQALVTEDDEPNTNSFEAVIAKGNSQILGSCNSLNTTTRFRTKGFTPYKRPSAEPSF